MSSSAGHLGSAVKRQPAYRRVESQIFMTHYVSELQLVSADVHGCPVLYMRVLDIAVRSCSFSELFIALPGLFLVYLRPKLSYRDICANVAEMHASLRMWHRCKRNSNKSAKVFHPG